MMKYDLVVAHRVCPALSTTAVGFPDKLSMVRATTESLARALDGVNAKVIVLLDGCPAEYAEIFRKSGIKNLTIEEFPGIGNCKTFGRQIEILSNVRDAESVYFSEDDYLYVKNAFREMLDFLHQPDVDFVTPLDHPDRYIGTMLDAPMAQIKVSDIRHWRGTGTTCLTFMTRADTVRRVKSVLETYARGNLDSTMWLGLTKERIWAFPTLFANLIRHYCFRSCGFGQLVPLAAWRWHGLSLSFRKKYTLWSPIPTLAVHLSSASLSLGAKSFWRTDMLPCEPGR